MFLLNAFSLNMFATFPVNVSVREITRADAAKAASGALSAVGHADTAAVFQSVLGVPVSCARATVTLKPGDTALVGQYSGPRLPEGATSLPEGATIKWLEVIVNKLSRLAGSGPASATAERGIFMPHHPECARFQT
jgi:hypothetical protein